MINNLSIMKKLLVVGIITFLSILILSAILMFNGKNIMIEEKKSKLMNIVELSYSLVDAEYKAFKSGQIDEATAKQNAINAVKKLRYNGSDYIWINDDTLPYPKMIMHPTAPALDGKVLDADKFNCATHLQYGINNNDVIETDGKKNLFQSFVEVTNKANSGFVTYNWTKPLANGGVTTELYPKLSYVKKFSEWGFVIGSGIYIDDVQEQFYKNLIKTSLYILIIIALLSLFFIIIIKDITYKINNVKNGLLSFFNYLSRESLEASLININSQDEFGQMAVVINDNIEKVKKGIDEDRRLIDETITVLGEFEQGDLCQRLELSVSNPALMQLKTVLNNMASNLENNIDNVLKVLEEYSHYNYLNKVDEKGLKEHILKLATGVNTLGNAVTTMLTTSLTNGIDLQSDASTLKQAVESLSTASNQQAASLEETAAAMEEMTSNVQNNVAKSNDMALMATQTDSAAKDGAVLASRTASAMTEIQSATNSINDAVAIIENIAFQTNILSLNAAVEAATAGDAGKGFAVVAQEVRNLANRSADAAKEIKAMASQAAHKSNEGMNIATELTRGFEVIADKIAQTASMVQDVSNANREQMQGIGQINTAVTQLDQMTQENAKVAAQADSIANATISKAEAMVQDALSKEFVGKSNIRATQSSTTGINATRTSKPVHAAKPVVAKHTSKPTAISNANKNSLPHVKRESDVWESF